MKDKLASQIRAFKRLDLACISFRQSKVLVEHVIEGGFSPTSRETATLYSACLTGIVTTYARPFVAADGLGSLSSKFEKDFPTKSMAEDHRDLLHIRHTVYAHRDLVSAEKFTLSPDSHPVVYESIIVIEPSKSGRGSAIHSEPAIVDIAEESLPGIVALCDFQTQRASADAFALLEEMGRGKTYKPGKYAIGKGFP